MNELTNNKLTGFKMWILPIVAVASIVVAFVSFGGGASAKVNRQINLGNKFLKEMDFEQAKACFQEAIAVDPNNRLALEGLMQTAYETKDYATLTQAVKTYVDVVCEEEKQSEERDEKIFNIQKNSQVAFDDVAEYMTFLESTDLETEDEDEQNEWMAASYLKCAETLWKNREYDAALEYVKKAMEIDPENSSVKDAALAIVRDYAYDCKNKQKYDDARDVIDWYTSNFGGNDFDELVAETESMEKADKNMQSVIERLNAAFDADEITLIEEIMAGDEFKECVKQMHSVIYSEALQEAGLNGKGTAIYNNDGYAYVYYGEFVDGKRQGEGLWYNSTNKNNLTKCSVDWENGVPSGNYERTYYSTMTTYGYGGVVLYTSDMVVNEKVGLVNGLFDGPCSVHGNVKGSYPYSYDATINYKNGVAERIEVGEYPSEILDYLPNPVALCYYTATNDGGYTWRTWSSYVQSVGGVNIKTPAPKVANVDITLE